MSVSKFSPHFIHRCESILANPVYAGIVGYCSIQLATFAANPSMKNMIDCLPVVPLLSVACAQVILEKQRRA
jgi:hypothetical protein